MAEIEPKIAGIILAAGESRRLGTPKQLLTWRKVPLVRSVARLAVDACLAPVVLVTGYRHKDVEKAVHGMDLVFAYNADWSIGQSTSIHTGISALPEEVSACLFFMSDQPQIPVQLVQKIMNKYIQDRALIIAPRAGERRGNPVLFERTTFNALRELSGNEGGRKLFDQYPVEYVEWQDASILIDVDTVDDYQKLKDLES